MPESGLCASGNVAAETWLASGMGLERSLCGFLCFNWAGRWALLVAQLVKNPPAVQETPVRFLGREDAVEKGEATHSSTLAWRIPMDRGACQATVPGVKKS